MPTPPGAPFWASTQFEKSLEGEIESTPEQYTDHSGDLDDLPRGFSWAKIEFGEYGEPRLPAMDWMSQETRILDANGKQISPENISKTQRGVVIDEGTSSSVAFIFWEQENLIRLLPKFYTDGEELWRELHDEE